MLRTINLIWGANLSYKLFSGVKSDNLQHQTGQIKVKQQIEKCKDAKMVRFN